MKNQHNLAMVTAAALCMFTLSTSAQSIPTVFNPGLRLCGMSDNAAYAISSEMGDTDVDNPHTVGGTLYDITNNKMLTISSTSGWAEVNDVADNGIVVGGEMGKPGYWDPQTGAWTTFNVPNMYAGGTLMAVTPDAKYAVGYFREPNNDYNVSPMMYNLETGARVKISNLPKKDMTGKDRRQNVFYNVSADGRYVLGQMSQSYQGELDEQTGQMRPALFSYVYDTSNDTWNAIGYDYDDATGKFTPKDPNLYFVQTQQMSCDGRWVTGTAYMVYRGGELEGGTEGFYSYRYDVETTNFEVYQGLNDANVGGCKITSDGIVLGYSPVGNPYPSAQIRYGKYFITLDQIIEQVYGMRVEDLVHDTVTGAFEALSSDGLSALMITYDNSYIITMTEPFVELASKVDLLRNYTLSIPEGSTINRVSEIKLTFERQILCSGKPQDIKLLDSQGNVVRSAAGASISVTNEHTLVVTFRSTVLTPGETYTVDIPENMVYLKEDPEVRSRRIQLHYVGRNEGPVKMRSSVPANNSAVAQFNSNPDVLTVTFDTPIKISDTASCVLYNEDDGSVIGAMGAMANGRQAIFYPVANYYLYKGSNYKVVIAAGSVTDLSGGGPNEEIELHFNGAYVRQLSNDDIYIFNAPCDSYDNFIFWGGETYEPAPIPTQWGFTAENPWLLIRESESTNDWALAAHSMHLPAAESDDWLITPQLFMPDANTYLAFDTQSYMQNRDDRLKVYVYSDDAVYNYFSRELADTFMAQGDLVVDEIISAGATDEGLSGEWTRIIVPLDKYAGKNIYIAFVNQNYDKSAIFIDNVQVIRNMDFLLTNQTPSTLVAADAVTVSGMLSPGSEIVTLKGIELQLIDEDGNTVDRIVDADASVAYGDAYSFTFAKQLSLTPGEETAYEIQVTSGEQSSTYAYTVKDLVFAPVKRVVLEEFTGSACGNCPLGIRAIENLQALYPDNFIALTLRAYESDIYAAGAVNYASALGFSAAPSGRINRGQILSPVLQNGSAGYTFSGRGIITSDGSAAYLWADAVQDELNVPAEAEVTLDPTYDKQTGEITVPCNVRFALDRNNASVAVFGVIIENDLPTYQLNYFNSSNDPLLGQWGVGGMYSQQTVTTWRASEVVKFVINGNAFNGTPLSESNFIAGSDYSITLNATVPAQRLAVPENCEVVVMIIDRATGRIINASEKPLITNGITDIETDDSGEAEYYNLQGIKVANPERGQIYIRVAGGKATKIVKN